MGSNMQRQAVPLLGHRAADRRPPAWKRDVALQLAAWCVRAAKKGTVTYVDADRIEIGGGRLPTAKFVGLNERTCQNQKPIVKVGQTRSKRARSSPTAPPRIRASWPWAATCSSASCRGTAYNFEDAIIISEELVKNDTYTSIHIEEFDVEIRETKLGREEFTRDIPNVSEKALRNLDENGIVRIGTFCRPGDILVGKVSPKSKTELTPEEKLLHAIFGRAGEDVKNDSLEVPSGVEGIVIDTQKFSPPHEPDGRRTQEVRKRAQRGRKRRQRANRRGIRRDDRRDGNDPERQVLTDEKARRWSSDQDATVRRRTGRELQARCDRHSQPAAQGRRREDLQELWPAVEAAIDDRDRKLNSMKRGDELRSGVLQMVKVYIATKRVISVGDKMAGRHGNKGVIAKILPMKTCRSWPTARRCRSCSIRWAFPAV